MSRDVFIDSSALVALLAKEADWQQIAARIEEAGRRFTSPSVILETVMVLSSRTPSDPERIEALLLGLLAGQEIEVLTLDQNTARAAGSAFARYGKGRHPARLNLGDCFSYACAREHRLALLYNGDDFAQTDLG